MPPAGRFPGRDAIKGDVEVRDARGAVIDHFNVNASYALGGLAGGQDSARMHWLYEAFAKQTIAALGGARP